MITVKELQEWLADAKPEDKVGIDEAGLTLVRFNADNTRTGREMSIGGYGEFCNECDSIVDPEDPYYSTPCGTFCETCMQEKHASECQVCANEFDLVPMENDDEGGNDE